MNKFKVGDQVVYQGEKTKVAIESGCEYVVEYSDGWRGSVAPEYGDLLDPKKRYHFAQEGQLTTIAVEEYLPKPTMPPEASPKAAGVRLYDLQIYFGDTPHPWTFKDVSNFCTEGAFLRLTSNKRSQWLPVANIFRIVELERIEA